MAKSDNKKHKKKNKGLLTLTFILGIITVVIVTATVIAMHFLGEVNWTTLDPDFTVRDHTDAVIADVTGVYEETSADTPVEELDEYKKTAQEALHDLGLEPVDNESVYNVLLIGSDTRQPGESGNSDTMMLLSINSDSGQIIATSFLRDLYVYIPIRNVYDKINSAYAYGGVELLIETINYNFSLKIDKFISVDFLAFINMVDVLGGLDVDVKEDELYWCNQYIHASNLLVGCDENSDYLGYADGSYQHLNGKQVLAYSRFRYVGNGDFTRTERQRRVMNLLFDKLKGMGATTVFQMLDAVLPCVTTNIPKTEFISLLAHIPEYSGYEIVSWGIPDENFVYLTENGMSNIGIDFSEYIPKLYGKIYSVAY